MRQLPISLFPAHRRLIRRNSAAILRRSATFRSISSQVVQSNLIDLGTFLSGPSGQPQKIADLVKREPKTPASVNEPQPMQVFLLVGTAISWRCAAAPAHEFELFA